MSDKTLEERAQSGIIPEPNRHALLLTLLLNDEAEGAAVRQALADFPAMTEAVAALDPDALLVSTLAIGAAAWDRLYPDGRPPGLEPFTALEDHGRVAPATAADLFVHIRAERIDLCFELAQQLCKRLAGQVSVVEEIHGFRYLDSRDLTGFVDGTENPKGEDRATVALLGTEAGAFAGGSFVHIQRYIHDLPSWEKLSVPEQEQVIARTKEDDVEFDSEAKPPTAHIKRASIKEDDVSVEMLRRSIPYGTVAEHGLYFISYAGRPDTFPRMLEQMIVADAEGHYDHLLNFSRAVTGAAFFAAPKDWLTAQA